MGAPHNLIICRSQIILSTLTFLKEILCEIAPGSHRTTSQKKDFQVLGYNNNMVIRTGIFISLF